jgi:hypothetical protein
MRWTRSVIVGRPDPATTPPELTSMAHAHWIHKGRRDLRRRAAVGVVHEVEEERRREEVGSGHHATRSSLHSPRPLDPCGGSEEGRATMV